MKQYFTGFITAVCLTASSFMFIGAESKNMGDIEVNSIKVVDNNGRITVNLGTNVIGGGWLGTYNANGKKTSYLGTGEGGTGILVTYNADGEETIFLRD
tara:strand:+ start:171 stop:467 length:297 start_codon:yes stop_codon:yes gene_type:complete